jgi:hypothetical protein
MQTKERLDQVAQFALAHLQAVARELAKPASDLDYRWKHTLRVCHYGRQLAEAEGANVELTLAACLLHDVAVFEDGDWHDHGRLGARLSRPYLQTLYAPAEAEHICYSVALHADDRADFEHPPTVESKIVSDADNIDRFDVYRLLIFCQPDIDDFDRLVVQAKARKEELEDYRRRQVMGTHSGNALFDRRLDYQIAFFEGLIRQSELSERPAWLV